MTDETLQQLVCDISNQYFRKPFRHRAYFNARLRTTGGRYILQTHHIEINPKSYEQFGMDELTGIIKHELCHYHLHIEGKGYQHKDRDFKNLLAQTKAPRFCSVIQKPISHSVQHTYMCESCGIVYIRKRRIDVAKYRCGKCAGTLFKKK